MHGKHEKDSSKHFKNYISSMQALLPSSTLNLVQIQIKRTKRSTPTQRTHLSSKTSSAPHKQNNKYQIIRVLKIHKFSNSTHNRKICPLMKILLKKSSRTRIESRNSRIVCSSLSSPLGFFPYLDSWNCLRTCLASTLPNSTPHWSKEQTFQTNPYI